MTNDANAAPVIDVTRPRSLSRRAGIVRLALAWILTLAALPYAWGRTIFVWMLIGRPESWMAAILGVVAVMIIALTVGVGRHEALWRRRGPIGFSVAGTWIVANFALLWMAAGSLVPRGVVAAVYAPGSLFIVWATWMFAGPWRWPTRLAALGSFAVLLGLFVARFEVRGLSGDSHVDFALRVRGSKVAEHGSASKLAGAAEGSLESDPARDFPQYLGPDRNSVLPHARLDRDWATHPPRELWRKPVGVAWSSFAVVGDLAFTQEQRDGEECVVCYRVRTGEEVWVHADKVSFTSSLGGPGPRATPTLHAGRVFSIGATGLFNCLDALTGQRIWSVDILKDNELDNIAHGVCGSPLVVDDLVLVSPTGGHGPSLAAYNSATGRRVWATGTNGASYSSPMLAELCGVRQVLVFDSAGVTGHDAAGGRPLWHFPWTNAVKTNASQPIPHAGRPDHVFCSTEYDKGCALFRVDHSADGTWSVQTIWSNNRLKTKFCTPVAVGDYVYGLDSGILACRDLATGKKGWKDGRYGHGQILLAGELLIVLTESGDVALVEPNPQRLHELGRIHALDGKTWNNPALAGPYLLVRNDHEAACYEVALAAD